MNYAMLYDELTRDEGRRNRIYTDTVGKITGGVGRNLTDVPFSNNEIDLMLANDVDRVVRQLDSNLPWWRTMTEARQRTVANMAFNLGINGLLGFVNTLAKMKAGDYAGAADGMLASKWSNQVGQRAQRLAATMRSGT